MADWLEHQEVTLIFSSMLFIGRLTDVPNQKPSKFNEKGYSHKFNWPDLRYEVALSLRYNSLLWAHGSFPCLDVCWSENTSNEIEERIMQWGKVYSWQMMSWSWCVSTAPRGMLHKYSRARSRHENRNARLKNFKILSSKFHHNLGKHSLCSEKLKIYHKCNCIMQSRSCSCIDSGVLNCKNCCLKIFEV